ncbi:MAG: ABC transporter permease [Bacteroidales bacterium]|nr:ABC transporter permease [Bacteroidales bacterium]
MWKNYLKTAWRNMIRQRAYSIINVLGLSIGMAAFILIALFVIHELSYDKFHTDAGRIYRVGLQMKQETSEQRFIHLMAPLAEALETEIPEIESANRNVYWDDKVQFDYGEKRVFEGNTLFTEKDFFRFYSHKLSRGNPETALVEPYSMVLTESLAKKLFGDQDPMGKMVKLRGDDDFKITGIMADPPSVTHMPISAVVSFATIYEKTLKDWKWDLWFGNFSFPTYVKLAKGASLEDVKKRMPEFTHKHLLHKWEKYGVDAEFFFQPLTEIHLHSHLSDELAVNGDIKNVYIFSTVAFFILLIAAINYINLSTARSLKRAREVGLRKTFGAERKQIIQQFLSESVITTLISLVISFILVEAFLPEFNNLAERNIQSSMLLEASPLILLGIVLLVGILAGSYPAFYLSCYEVDDVLRNKAGKGAGHSAFRNSLVVVQFVISIGLIIGTGIIYSQLRYMTGKDLGYEKEHLLSIDYYGEDLEENYASLKGELLSIPQVKSVSVASGDPVNYGYMEGHLPEGFKDPMMVNVLFMDDDYIETCGMELILGENFRAEAAGNDLSMIVNETMVKQCGWDNPIGKKVERNNKTYNVIGVVKDFHFASLHTPIGPLVIRHEPDRFGTFLLKISGKNVSATINQLEGMWKGIDLKRPMNYSFMDRKYNATYSNDQRFGTIFLYFSILAIFIACLGLLGLAAYTAEQRTREIGIRKVHGATTVNILKLLSSDLAKWIVVASIIAWPLGWYFMDKWLEGFAYHIDMKWWLFGAAAVLALFVAMATVNIQAYRAASQNPADTLKYE